MLVVTERGDLFGAVAALVHDGNAVLVGFESVSVREPADLCRCDAESVSDFGRGVGLFDLRQIITEVFARNSLDCLDRECVNSDLRQALSLLQNREPPRFGVDQPRLCVHFLDSQFAGF